MSAHSKISLGKALGAIISGSYISDKMSPLFDHIRHMVYTTGVSYMLTLIFGIMGMKCGALEIAQSALLGIINGLKAQF